MRGLTFFLPRPGFLYAPPVRTAREGHRRHDDLQTGGKASASLYASTSLRVPIRIHTQRRAPGRNTRGHGYVNVLPLIRNVVGVCCGSCRPLSEPSLWTQPQRYTRVVCMLVEIGKASVGLLLHVEPTALSESLRFWHRGPSALSISAGTRVLPPQKTPP